MVRKNRARGEKEFTASVWILSRGIPKKMLLVHHKKLGKWLQPGGHIEKDENPIEAAIREVREETGLDISLLIEKAQIVDRESSFLPVPDFFMEQKIPAINSEPEHYHLDVNYVIKIDEQEVVHNALEAHGIQWFTKEEILELPIHGDTRIIVEKLME